MPYTVAVSFEQFFNNVNLSGDHRLIANTRRDHLISLLSKNLSIVDSFPSGSIPRFTAVSGYADLDIMVVLHHGKHLAGKKPSEVLQNVRDILGQYKTRVRKNGQAVTLYYDTWPNVDIVPVSSVVNEQQEIVYYLVPDMSRENWLESRPKRHTSNVKESVESYGPEFRKIVKMVKWWNHQHSELLQSYHIEVLALKILGSKFSSYPWDIFQFFDKAYALTSSVLWHDGAVVDTYLDWNTREEVRKRLHTAKEKSSSAWYATYGENDDRERAIGLWRQIFGSQFPAYG